MILISVTDTILTDYVELTREIVNAEDEIDAMSKFSREEDVGALRHGAPAGRVDPHEKVGAYSVSVSPSPSGGGGLQPYRQPWE